MMLAYPYLMKRKVIKLATNTMVVSLPSQWVKKSGIAKGSEVNIEEMGDVLSISPESKERQKKFVLDLERIHFSKAMLSYLYQKGYDEIELVNLDSKSFAEVKERVSDLMGFEIIDRSERRCLVKAVSKEIDSEFDAILRRTFLITLEMANNIHEAFVEREKARFEEIKSLEKTTNMFTDFCKRVLSKGAYKDPENTVYAYVLIRDLEKVADGYRRICEAVLSSSGKSFSVSKDVLSVLVKVNSFLEMFYKLFYKFDQSLFEKFQSGYKDILSSSNSALEKSKGLDSVILGNLLFILDTVHEMTGPFFILNFSSISKRQ